MRPSFKVSLSIYIYSHYTSSYQQQPGYSGHSKLQQTLTKQNHIDHTKIKVNTMCIMLPFQEKAFK